LLSWYKQTKWFKRCLLWH